MNKNPESWTSKLYEYRVRVERDEDTLNPRQDFTPAGRMVCWHSRYNLGDTAKDHKGDALFERIKHRDPDRFFETLAEDVVSSAYPESLLLANAERIARKHFIILPLFLYDHSGISMSTTRTYPFNCPWDSGQVGWIYFPKAELEKEKWTQEQAVKYLQGEVKTYDQYIEGNVFGYIIERRPLINESTCEAFTDDPWWDKEYEEVYSCWGFYGEVYEGAYDPQYYIDADEETVKADAVGAGI